MRRPERRERRGDVVGAPVVMKDLAAGDARRARAC
jgi:hypothetical protein